MLIYLRPARIASHQSREMHQLKPEPQIRPRQLQAPSERHRRGERAGIVSNTRGGQSRSKKALILEYRETHNLGRAAMPEIEAIHAELRSRLGESGRTSLSYITNVLREGIELG